MPHGRAPGRAVADDNDRLLVAADRLYGLDRGEFTAQRDSLVREHRADREFSSLLKSLRKPTVAAWVVNQLVRREFEHVQHLLAVGASLREAQRNLDPAALRELTVQRRQVTAAVTVLARRTALEVGQPVTHDVALQVEQTLTAAMIDENAAAGVRSGLLTRPLSASGGEPSGVAGALAVPGAIGFVVTPSAPASFAAPDLRVVDDPQVAEAARRAARERLESAVAGRQRAHTEVERADRQVRESQASRIRAQTRLADLRRAVVDAEAAVAVAELELDGAEGVRGEAASALEAAEVAVREARTEWEGLAD